MLNRCWGPACLLLLSAVDLLNAEWPQFRGPNGSGVEPGLGYPAEFSTAKNLAWKAAIPYAQSSPVVVSNRVYLTTSSGDQLITLCLDARTGKELWRREIRRERAHKLFRANDAASPTPAADAQGVIAFFADFGLVAYSPEGKELWRHPLGPFKNFYGMAASPIVAGDLVVMLCDQTAGSFLLGLDRLSGRQRWRTDRPGMTVGWATPVVFRPQNNPAQLIVLGSTRLDSYYLSTGERRWWLPIGSEGALGVPLTLGDAIFINTRGTTEPYLPPLETALEKYDKNKDKRISSAEFAADKDWTEHFGWIDANSDGFIDAAEWNEARTLGMGDFGAIAIRPANAQGELPKSAIRWRSQKNLPYVPAPLIYNNVYYTVRTGGIITSLDPTTGRLLKEGRTPQALGEYYASPVAADGKVYLASEEGKVTVLKAAGQWDVLGVNDLKEEIHATPALSGGRVYIRTRDTLYCFARM
jgi:outer membrane protein assembly factor BamB